jgi:protein disulfide-isomerase A1
VLFYTEWCGHCTALKPEFLTVSEQLNEFGLAVAAVECVSNPNLCQEQVHEIGALDKETLFYLFI